MVNRSETLPPNSRFCADRGTAITEAALAAPVLLYLVLGIMEFGLVYRDYLTITDAVNDAAKNGSIMSKYTTSAGENGDFVAMSMVRQDMANIPVRTIDRIVFFAGLPSSAGNPMSQVPPACKSGSYGPKPGSKCNVYNPYDAFRAVQTRDTAYFVCSSGQTSCGWNPANRRDGPKWYDIEYFGAYIKINRPMLTGLFGSTFSVEAAAVVRLEPGQLA